MMAHAPHDESNDDPPAAPLTETAQKAMDLAETRAEERRLKHAQKDQEKAARATVGNSKMSSGIRVDPSGGLVPGVEGRTEAIPEAVPPPPDRPVTRAMPEATTPPQPVSLKPSEPEGQTAAELLVPADAQTTAREEAGRAAFALVEEQREREAAKRVQVRKDVMYYVLCHRCGGPGIWMTKRGLIGANDWWSNYKPRGVPWPSKDVWCQCCWALFGAQNSLKIMHDTVNGKVRSITPYSRKIVEIATSEYARLTAAAQPEKPEPVTADG